MLVVSFVETNPLVYEIHLCWHILETSIYLLSLFDNVVINHQKGGD